MFSFDHTGVLAAERSASLVSRGLWYSSAGFVRGDIWNMLWNLHRTYQVADAPFSRENIPSGLYTISPVKYDMA